MDHHLFLGRRLPGKTRRGGHQDPKAHNIDASINIPAAMERNNFERLHVGDGTVLLQELHLVVPGSCHIGARNENPIDVNYLQDRLCLSPILCKESAVLLTQVWDRRLLGSRKILPLKDYLAFCLCERAAHQTRRGPR